MQNQLSREQKSAKRRKLGKLIGDGVIIKDGKFECQFCHKVFAERHRYYGHVGTHVRYQGLSAEALLDDKTFCNPAPVAALSHDFSSAETKAESSTPITASEPHFASANMHCQGENHEIDSRESETRKIPSAVIAHDINVMDEKFSSSVNGEVAFLIMSHGMVSEDILMTSSDNQVHKMEENTNGRDVKKVEASHFEHDKASDVKNIEVGEVALHIMFREKVAEDTLMTSSDNQDSDYHHTIEENTGGTDVKNMKASHFKDSSDAKNIEVSDVSKVDKCGVKKIDDHDCNDGDSHFGNVRSNSLPVNDVDSNPCLDVTSIAPNDVPNRACRAANKVAQFFPESMSLDGCQTNDSNLTGIIPESNVDAYDSIAIKANNPLNFISMPRIDLDKTVLGRSNGREMSSSVVISDAEKYGTEHRLESENQLITLSANGPNYAIEKDATDTHVRNMEESDLVEMVKSCRKNELASSNVFTVEDSARNILPLDFNASCTNMPFVSRSSGNVDRNRVHTFDIGMKECVIGDIDEPNVELDRCFNGSSSEHIAANNSFHDSENSLGFDFSLGSPWLRSSEHIPDVDMNLDQVRLTSDPTS